MGTTKEMFIQMCEDELNNTSYINDDHQYKEWLSRERVSSKTQSIVIFEKLFKSFGEPYKNKEDETRHI